MSLWKKIKKLVLPKKSLPIAPHNKAQSSHRGVEIDGKGKENVDVDKIKQLY